MQQELGREQDGDLPAGSRVDQVEARAAGHRALDERQGDLVDPAEVDPLGSEALLQHESPVAGDRHQTRRVLVLQEDRVPGLDRTGHLCALHAGHSCRRL